MDTQLVWPRYSYWRTFYDVEYSQIPQYNEGPVIDTWGDVWVNDDYVWRRRDVSAEAQDNSYCDGYNLVFYYGPLTQLIDEKVTARANA